MLTLQHHTEEKLEHYSTMFGGDSDKMIRNILLYRVQELEKSTKIIHIDLQKFERKYDMTSAEFYEKFENGELGDENSDFYQWSGEFEVYQNYQKELKFLYD